MSWQYILTFLLSIATGVTAVLHIRVVQLPGPERVHIFRPLTLFLLAAVALLAPQPVSIFYKSAIMLALYVAAAMSLLIMIPGTPAVVSFGASLVVYFLYFIAFSSQTIFFTIPTPAVLLLILFGFLIYRAITPHTRELKSSVIVYLVLTGLMGWQALELWWQIGEVWTVFAAIGVILLMMSDTALAVDRFRAPIPRRKVIVLATFYIAHWLIAVSVWGTLIVPFA